MSDLAVVEERASSISIITNDNYMERVMKLADLMAKSKVTVPKHLQGSPGDCAAIIMQAMNWGMDPFIVAQKTHIVNGNLGYEAQLVNAVVQNSNAIKGSFKYEYKGDECRVGAVLNGETEITWNEWLSASRVTTKNSPLWKTNEKQQMGYLQVKNWARAYCPGAILGVYSADELQDAVEPEKDITAQAETVKEESKEFPDSEFLAKADGWRKSIKDGRKTVDELIVWIEAKGFYLNDGQKATIKTWAPEVIDQQKVTDSFVADMESAESAS